MDFSHRAIQGLHGSPFEKFPFAWAHPRTRTGRLFDPQRALAYLAYLRLPANRSRSMFQGRGYARFPHGKPGWPWWPHSPVPIGVAIPPLVSGLWEFCRVDTL